MADSHTRRLAVLRTALEQANGRPLTYSELAARGVDKPAQAIYELELDGERLLHVAGGVVLTPRAPPEPSRDRARRRKGRARFRAGQGTHGSVPEAARRDDVSSGAGTRRDV
jgi:hypothetical protein